MKLPSKFIAAETPPSQRRDPSQTFNLCRCGGDGRYLAQSERAEERRGEKEGEVRREGA
jgi:hypothetical protein